MPRPRRLHVPGGIYHVTLRGNHRHRIFERPADYQLIETLVEQVATDFHLVVHAYCWMPNHIHLAVEVADHPLAQPMQKLASMYARRIQARQPTTGHFFERRYHSVLVDTDRYLFALIRYIHLNPVRAALVGTANQYRWSSHTAYLGAAPPIWMCCNRVLSLLSHDTTEARTAYAKLMRQSPTAAELAYLRGQRTREAAEADSREALSRADPVSLDELIRDECARLGVDPHSLLAPAKDRRHVMARACITWRARRLDIGTLHELAEKLGRSPASLSEGLRRAQRRDPEVFAAETRSAGSAGRKLRG